MTYTIIPPIVDVGRVREGQTLDVQAVARVAGAQPTGKTLIKRDGTWYCKQYPSQNELNEAEHFFLGGREYVVSDELYAEMFAALDNTPCKPINVTPGLYPSAVTFPGDETFTGDPSA